MTLIDLLRIKQQPGLDDDNENEQDGFFAKIKSKISTFDESVLQATLTNK